MGWVVAAPELSSAVRRVRQWTSFAVATPLQVAVAHVLREAAQRDYYQWLARMYQAKRDQLVAALNAAGLDALVPEGAYYVMGRISELGWSDDVAFCRALTERCWPAPQWAPPRGC